MTQDDATPSARKTELLEAAYRYVLEHGLADLSLRPLAAAVGSSPRVLLYLFDSKDHLVRALLARARQDELDVLGQIGRGDPDLGTVAERVWSWLAAPEHRTLLTLWLDAYAHSLVEPDGPWAGFARDTVADWLAVLSGAQPPGGSADSTPSAVLAILRGGLLDLLATGETARVTAAVQQSLTPLVTAAG